MFAPTLARTVVPKQINANNAVSEVKNRKDVRISRMSRVELPDVLWIDYCLIEILYLQKP
jgi:hypothetical protein